MDDEEDVQQTLPNPNFRIKGSESSRRTRSPQFRLDDPLGWASQQQNGITAPYVNHLVSMGGSSSIVAGFSSPSDSLRIFDVVRGGLIPQRILHAHKGGITGVKVDPQDPHNIVWSSGIDGRVQGLDLRVAESVCLLQGAFSQARPFLSLDISTSGTVAAGTEQNNEDASIVYWDKRNPNKATCIHASTHSEDINLLSFSTSDSRLLLSGAADGLLSITDVLEHDEDEAVKHVGNWGCSIAKAGWANNSSKPIIWSTSDMETMATWSEELDLIQDYGDVRNSAIPSWKTDYIIGAEWIPPESPGPWGVTGMTIWCGNNQGDVALLRQGRKDLTRWHVEQTLRAGHDEIVRCVCVDTKAGFLVTGAEDGKIAVWSTNKSEDSDVEMAPGSPTGVRRKRSDELDSKILKRKR